MLIWQQASSPSALRLTLFLAEKGLDIPRREIDLRAGDNLKPDFKAKSLNGRIPVLEFDNGDTLCESVAICRYFEALYPEITPLFGTTPLEIARIEMWSRIVELQGIVPAMQALRNLKGIFKDRENCFPEWGEESRLRSAEFLNTLERQLAATSWLAGSEFSVADISAWVFVRFIRTVQLSPGEQHVALRRWYQRIAQRPSVIESVNDLSSSL